MKLSSVVLALGVVAFAGSAAAERDRHDVGEEIPTFTLRAVNADVLGESYVTIDRYFGEGAKHPKKALLLSFFATYCEPCKKEIPLLAALDEQYRDKGLQIVLVSIDSEAEKIETAKTLAGAAGVRFPVLSDRFNIVAKRYFVAKLPNSYLVGPDGRVAMANVGYNEDISKQLLDEIRKMLGEPTSEPLPESLARHLGRTGAPEVIAAKSETAVDAGLEPVVTGVTAVDTAVDAAGGLDQAQMVEDDAAPASEVAEAKAKKKKGKHKGKYKKKLE